MGLRRLDKGLAAMPEVSAEKEWHAYLLDWNAPPFGEQSPVEQWAAPCVAGSCSACPSLSLLGLQPCGQPSNDPGFALLAAGWRWPIASESSGRRHSRQQFPSLPPSLAPTGEPILEALKRKFGPQAGALMQRVAGAGRGDGAAFANWAWRANTVKGGRWLCGGHCVVER